MISKKPNEKATGPLSVKILRVAHLLLFKIAQLMLLLGPCETVYHEFDTECFLFSIMNVRPSFHLYSDKNIYICHDILKCMNSFSNKIYEFFIFYLSSTFIFYYVYSYDCISNSLEFVAI